MLRFIQGRASELWLPDVEAYCGPLTADLVTTMAVDTGNHWSMLLPMVIAVFTMIFGPLAKVRPASVAGLRTMMSSVLVWVCMVAWPGSGVWKSSPNLQVSLWKLSEMIFFRWNSVRDLWLWPGKSPASNKLKECVRITEDLLNKDTGLHLSLQSSAVTPCHVHSLELSGTHLILLQWLNSLLLLQKTWEAFFESLSQTIDKCQVLIMEEGSDFFGFGKYQGKTSAGVGNTEPLKLRDGSSFSLG